MSAAKHLHARAQRLLFDLYWLRAEAVALDKLGGKENVGLDFFKVAHIALSADFFGRLGRILDKHSFWAVRAVDSAAIDAALLEHGLPITTVENFAKRLKPIRDQVLAHSDARVALDPDVVYRQAHIEFQEVTAIVEGLWKAVMDYYGRKIGEPPTPAGTAYTGVDIDEIHAAYMEMRRVTDSNLGPNGSTPIG